MAAGYFEEKRIELCNAVGEFAVVESYLEEHLPFPKEQMNLVIKYEEDEDLMGLKSDFKKLYPGMAPEVPKMADGGRTFKAMASGKRSAIIHHSQFDNDVEVDGHGATGIKIKGCRMGRFPPLPSPFTPDMIDGNAFPEIFTSFEEDGKPFKSFKDQPHGMTVDDARREVMMSLLAHDMGIPVNVAGLGYGVYSGSFYPGYPNASERSSSGQMGTGVFATFGPDERVSDIVLNIRDLDDSELLGIPVELANMVINNLQHATHDLGVDYRELFYDMVFHRSGEILGQMHSSGIIHGPRQSHYMNYTMPTKECRDIQICDFEHALLVNQITDIQALKLMTDDLYQLIANSNRVYRAAVASVMKALESDRVPDGFDALDMLYQFQSIDMHPADAVLCGYMDDEIRLCDVIDNGKWDLEYHVAKKISKGR